MYQTSMIVKYGDSNNVKNDVKTLNDIIDRQGTALLIDVIAEYIGNKNLKYKWNKHDVNNIVENLTNELRDAILERV